MSLQTFSSFYYGHTVDTTNFAIDFSEGGPELLASLDPGSYSLEEYAGQISAAMNRVGGQEYTTEVDRETRQITISAPGDFELLVATGSRLGTAAWTLMGFDGTDKTGDDEYEGANASGFEYRPQYILQEHVPKEQGIKAIDPVVNKSAAGITEVVRFGTERFVAGNIRYITDREMGGNSPIENNASGYADALQFMEYAVQKKTFEYMPDRDSPDTFDTVILESTPKNPNGTDYELKELYGEGLPGFYETGRLTLRVFE